MAPEVLPLAKHSKNQLAFVSSVDDAGHNKHVQTPNTLEIMPKKESILDIFQLMCSDAYFDYVKEWVHNKVMYR